MIGCRHLTKKEKEEANRIMYLDPYLYKEKYWSIWNHSYWNRLVKTGKTRRRSFPRKQELIFCLQVLSFFTESKIFTFHLDRIQGFINNTGLRQIMKYFAFLEYEKYLEIYKYPSEEKGDKFKIIVYLNNKFFEVFKFKSNWINR